MSHMRSTSVEPSASVVRGECKLSTHLSHAARLGGTNRRLSRSPVKLHHIRGHLLPLLTEVLGEPEDLEAVVLGLGLAALRHGGAQNPVGLRGMQTNLHRTKSTRSVSTSMKHNLQGCNEREENAMSDDRKDSVNAPRADPALGCSDTCYPYPWMPSSLDCGR